MPRVAIVGGGITGLTAAYALEQSTDFEVMLLEADCQLGGKVQTVQKDGFTIEEGPDSIYAGKPGALELVNELGIEHETIEPQAKGFHLLVGDRLHAVPPGLASLGSIAPEAIERANFLSPEGKARALAEPGVPPGDGEDESIRSFFTRRFGAEFSTYVAEPILAGTHGGDPANLSMRALYPFYLDLEHKYGSLKFPQTDAPSPKGPMFISFKKGMATLIEALQASLKRTVWNTGDRLLRIQKNDRKFIIWTSEAPYKTEVDYLLLAIPASQAAIMLRPSYPEASELVNKIGFASSVIVTSAYKRSDIAQELTGTGFLTPFDSEGLLTGCTWSSSKWPYRAPDDKVLLRFFYGGAGRPNIESVSDNELRQRALCCAEEILGIKSDPDLMRVSRWEQGLPQYTLGHTGLMDRVENLLEGSGIVLAGSSYRGVGIPDCIRQGRAAAAKFAEGMA